jgi:hypothetical protein
VERIEKFLKKQASCALVVEATIGYEWFVFGLEPGGPGRRVVKW